MQIVLSYLKDIEKKVKILFYTFLYSEFVGVLEDIININKTNVLFTLLYILFVPAHIKSAQNKRNLNDNNHYVCTAQPRTKDTGQRSTRQAYRKLAMT